MSPGNDGAPPGRSRALPQTPGNDGAPPGRSRALPQTPGDDGAPPGRSRALPQTPAERPLRHAVLAAGTLVGGAYRIAEVIGEGSQSVVYLARREPSGEEVALKVIHRHLCGDAQISRRFEREARILRRLEGEHVARLLDFIEDDGLLALALERVHGVSLEAMLAERAPLDLDVAIEITLQVCAALGAAHANGIVHRDLKTANVLVERPSADDGDALRIKVVDFGLSKLLQGDVNTALTEQGMIFGTPEYMAPEQARGDEVDARSDLYAAGVILYEMTVGAPPFSGRSALGTMSAHLSEAPPSPRAACPGSSITPALEKVILRALAKSPADRFASARELAQAIAAARDEPLVITPRAVDNPDEIGIGDTDLQVARPSFAQARTLRAEELAALHGSAAEAAPIAVREAREHAPPSGDPERRAPRPARRAPPHRRRAPGDPRRAHLDLRRAATPRGRALGDRGRGGGSGGRGDRDPGGDAVEGRGGGSRLWRSSPRPSDNGALLMRLRFSRGLAPLLAVGASALAMAPASAWAYDVLATPCTTLPLTCGIGAVTFSKVDALPIQFNFDTGWVPGGSPVEVRLFADVWANTHVSLTGALETSWPATLTLAAPGDKADPLTMKGGDFGFHYGADFAAQGKVDISVAGVSYTWQGDLPYVPQFDLEVDADQPFDAWGYTPGVTLSSTSMPQQIASIDVSSIIGTSIPGIDGGFALDVAVELDATYVTERIVIDTTDGHPVAGGPITAPAGTSSVPFHQGANIELDVHPEGTVNYDGVVHLIPTFWVSLLGNKWQIPIVDVPVSFPITENQWSFTPQRVHVPLPDLALPTTVLDFGEVTVGDTKALDYQLWNAGEAKAAATMTTSDALTFPLVDESTGLGSGQTFLAGVEFIPRVAGPFSGQITVASNDPKSPVQIVVLKGVGIPAAAPPPPEGAAVSEPSGCGCRTTGDGGGGARSRGARCVAAMALARGRSRWGTPQTPGAAGSRSAASSARQNFGQG